MSLTFRFLLVIAAVYAFYFVMHNIKKTRLQIVDSLFWFFFSLMLLLLAVFPGITFFFSRILGIESPANLIFLFMVAILLHRVFVQALRISQLDNKIKELTQNMALYEEMDDKRTISGNTTDLEEK